MIISEKDRKILEQRNAWAVWMEEHLPTSLLSHLREHSQGMLLDLLRHYHHSGGCANNIYGDGAVLVVENDDRLLEQLERMVSFNIRRTALIRVEGKTPSGKQNLTVAHFDFASNSTPIPTNLTDSTKRKEIEVASQKLSPDLSVSVVGDFLASMDRAFLEESDPAFVAQNLKLSWDADQDINVKAEVQQAPNAEGEFCIALANRRASQTGFFRNLLKVIRF